MPLGPGKYDDLCTVVRDSAKADAAIVIIHGGERGNGFSVQGPFEFALSLPAILRSVADNIEETMRGGNV